MNVRHAVLALTMTSAVALSACGESQTRESTTSERRTTRGQAVAQIGEVRRALDTAMAQVRRRDAARAEETVANGYLEHFEKVEGPLEKVDGELNEKLEESLSTDLRQKIRSGASAAEVRKLTDRIRANLDEAERKLR